MCGRFTNKMTWPEIHDLYNITNDDFRPNLAPRYNAAPTQMLPVVKPGCELVIMRWGFEREWAKGTIINARDDKVASSRVFKKSFETCRCLIPADGFYEWRKGDKQPFRFIMKDEAPMTFAGIWETWTATKDGRDFSAGDEVETFVIITTEANEHVRAIDHERMPVILDASEFDGWLDASSSEELLDTFPADRMTAYAVSTRVNSVRNDDAGCIEFVANSSE